MLSIATSGWNGWLGSNAELSNNWIRLWRHIMSYKHTSSCYTVAKRHHSPFGDHKKIIIIGVDSNTSNYAHSHYPIASRVYSVNIPLYRKLAWLIDSFSAITAWCSHTSDCSNNYLHRENRAPVENLCTLSAWTLRVSGTPHLDASFRNWI
jgi:hypothetical protein